MYKFIHRPTNENGVDYVKPEEFIHLPAVFNNKRLIKLSFINYRMPKQKQSCTKACN